MKKKNIEKHEKQAKTSIRKRWKLFLADQNEVITCPWAKENWPHAQHTIADSDGLKYAVRACKRVGVCSSRSHQEILHKNSENTHKSYTKINWLVLWIKYMATHSFNSIWPMLQANIRFNGYSSSVYLPVSFGILPFFHRYKWPYYHFNIKVSKFQSFKTQINERFSGKLIVCSLHR